jgi:hypothetical protein
MFIDNELSLDEKISFVEQIHKDQSFTNDAVSYLKQEKVLRSMLAKQVPDTVLPLWWAPKFSFLAAKPFLVAFVASLLIIAALYFTQTQPPQTDFQHSPAWHQHRFVIYQPGSKQVEIAGSFTNWQKISLQPAGSAGYWELKMEIPPGKHSFSYIVDGSKILADPTISLQENDDFGTINSILDVEV